MKPRADPIPPFPRRRARAVDARRAGVRAEAPEPDELQTVTVTGVRASMGKSIDLKRSAGTVQDSISALELGKFPDDNVADSLSHITGVAITRTAGGEGQSVSVRGLGPEYTLTTFNGRILATDGAGRDFAYDVLPADVISGADVIKGAQASLSEGAIGGLVNLRSASPFDQTGQHGAARFEGDRNLMSELDGYKFSGVYSNTFANDTVGVLLGVVYAQRKDRTDIAGNDGGWTRNADPNDESWMWGNAWGGNIDPNGNDTLDEDEYGLIAPGQFRVGSILEEKKRRAITAKLEWRPSDAVKVVVDGLKTRLDSPQVGYQQSYYPLFAPGRWSDMEIEDGIVTGFTMDERGSRARAQSRAAQHDDASRRRHRSLRHQRRVDGQRLAELHRRRLSLDFQALFGRPGHLRRAAHEPAERRPHFARRRRSAERVRRVRRRPRADERPRERRLRRHRLQHALHGTARRQHRGRGHRRHHRRQALDREVRLRRTLNFGVTTTKREKLRDLVNNTLNGGADYYSGTYAINVGDLDGDVISHSFRLPNFMNNVNADFPRTFLAFDVPTYLAALEAYDGTARPGGGTYDFSNAAPQWNPLESYRVSEKTTGLYVQADLGGERWNADVGVRFVKTKTTARAWDAPILGITENGPFNYTADYADPTPISQDGDYNFVLPSANFTWRFTDELQLRVGAAKTMARPPVDKLAPTNTTASVSWGEFTQIFGGNVDLKPYSAKQGDISLEWYFAENSIVNVATFYKRIENQITTSWEPAQDIGVPGYLFNVSRPINGDYAKVRGYEFGVQHFWENGLGFRAQYTRNTSKSFVGDEERPLEGIAPSTYSVSLNYERGSWSLGATADHTDGFVTAINVLGVGYNEKADELTWLTAHSLVPRSTTRSPFRSKDRTCSMTSRPTASTAIRCFRRDTTATAVRSTWA